MGWTKYMDKSNMLQLTKQRETTSMKHSAYMFNWWNEPLEIRLAMVFIPFVITILKHHQLKYPQDFIVFHSGKKAFSRFPSGNYSYAMQQELGLKWIILFAIELNIRTLVTFFRHYRMPTIPSS